MRVSLVFPRLKYKCGDPPLGVAYLGSYLIENTKAEVSILDMTFNPSFDFAEEYIRKNKPDIMGIYVDTLMYKNAVMMAQIAKRYGIVTVAGGPHASILPDTLVDFFDLVVVGEGELVFSDIINNFRKGKFSRIKGIWFKKGDKIVKTGEGKRIESLDELGFPARGLLNMKNYFRLWHALDCVNPKLKGTGIIASRGCLYGCSFCQPTLRTIFGKNVRKRSPMHVVEELKILKKKYHMNAFFFHDDTLTSDHAWVHEFCSLLKYENMNFIWGCNTRADVLDKKIMRTMYGAGLRVFHMGVESGSQRILDKIYNKGIKLGQVKKTIKDAKKIGIKTLTFFMLGAPTETEEEIKKTIRFAVSLDAIELSATITTPLPKTYLYDKMKGNYKIKKDFGSFDYYSKRAFQDKKLPFKKLKKYQMWLLFRFYTHPKRWPYIAKHLTSVAGFKKMVLKMRRFI